MKTISLLTGLATIALLTRPVFAATTLNVTTTGDTHSLGYATEGSPDTGSALDANNNISLRSALEYASSAGGEFTINLPAGTYDLILGNLVVGVQGNTTITIHGQGTSANTIIHQTEAHRMVFLVNYNLDANVVFNLDTVTVSGGSEDPSDPDFFGGGGAILAGGSSSAPGNALSLTGVTFTGNSASSTADAASGGAIIMTGGGDLTVNNCVFSDNHSGSSGVSGGGAIFFDTSGNPGNVIIKDSTFVNNSAPSSGGEGGALYLAGGNTFNVSQCSFTGNSAGGRGGAIVFETGHLTANFNIIAGNSAPSGFGSGLFMLTPTNNAVPTGGWADVRNNWWGGNLGPNGTGGDTVATTTADGMFGVLLANSALPLSANQVAFSPWITLVNTANPTAIGGGGTTVITASFLQNSLGQALTATQVAALVGLPVAWVPAFHGSISGEETTIQADGEATANFTNDGTCNNGRVEATVDNATVAATVTVQCSDLTVSKANNTLGAASLGGNWTWTIHVANGGTGPAIFADGNNLLTDNLPNANVSYGAPSLANASGLTGTVTPTIDGNGNLTCAASGAVQLAGGGSFDVLVTATPTSMGTFVNPRAGGICRVNPDGSAIESNESNNDATANSVTVTCPAISAVTAGSANICQGSATVITVTVTGGAPPYSVTLSSGATEVSSSPVEFTVSPVSQTTYFVSSGADANGCPISASGDATISIMTPPTAGPDLLGTVENTPVSAAVAKLLANDSSPIDGPLSLVGVSAKSAENGSVALSGGLVTYSPAAGFSGTDSFTYTLSDGRCSAQGLVTVYVTDTTKIPILNALSITGTLPHVSVVFLGIPGQVYVVQWALSAAGPWTDFADGTIVAGSTGLVQYTDSTEPPPPARFFRTRVGP